MTPVGCCGPPQRLERGQPLAAQRSRLVSTLVRRTTTNFITWPVVPGSAAGKSVSGTPPPKGSSGPSLIRKSSVPVESPVKSTMTSARSAGAMGLLDGTGSGRKPPSAPICQKGSAADAGLFASGSVAIFKIRKRELQPLRQRNRYGAARLPVKANCRRWRRPCRQKTPSCKSARRRYRECRDRRIRRRTPGCPGTTRPVRVERAIRSRADLVESSEPAVGAYLRGAGPGRTAGGRSTRSRHGEVEACRSRIDVQAGHPERVVVIPESGRPLVVLILEGRRARSPSRAELAPGIPP